MKSTACAESLIIVTSTTTSKVNQLNLYSRVHNLLTCDNKFINFPEVQGVFIHGGVHRVNG